MSEEPALSLWNVTFAGDHFWIGTTVPGYTEQMAENVARDQIHLEGDIPWDVISRLREVEVEYLGLAD